MDGGRGGNEVAGKLVRLVASAGPKNPFFSGADNELHLDRCLVTSPDSALTV